MAVEILRAGLEHLETLTPLFDGYRRFYGQEADLDAASAFLAARLRARDSVLLLALDDSTSPPTGAGFVQLYPSFSSVGMVPILILNDLFVAEGARRRGIARLLMDAASETARASGAARIRLSTATGNTAAKALYASSGYRQDGFEHYELSL